MKLNRKQTLTVVHILRKEAKEQRFMHGRKLIEKPGGIFITPNEMEELADEIESEHKPIKVKGKRR